MIPLTFLYDEYIDRSKLSEQKNPLEYIVPPPTRGVGTETSSVLIIDFTRVESLASTYEYVSFWPLLL